MASLTPYYDDGQVVIYHSDVTCWPHEDDEATFAAVITSPPYNVGIAYDGTNDNLPWLDYWKLASDTAHIIEWALRPGGRCWVNVAPVVAEVPTPAAHHSGRTAKARESLVVGWGTELENVGLEPCDIVCWSSMRGSGTAWGSWQSPSAPNIRGDWEALLVHYKGQWQREAPPGQEGYRDEMGGWPELVSNVWTLRPERRTDHPAPFPVELAARAIRLSTWPGETVLDPFMGSGTTLVAAKQLGRRAVGVEMSERYCEIAARRLSQGAFDFGEAV